MGYRITLTVELNEEQWEEIRHGVPGNRWDSTPEQIVADATDYFSGWWTVIDTYAGTGEET